MSEKTKKLIKFRLRQGMALILGFGSFIIAYAGSYWVIHSKLFQ